MKMSPENIPERLVLRVRGYGRRTKRGTWIAACIDLDLIVERPSFEEAKEALWEQVCSYVKAVADTDDKKSIARLLDRPAPLRERIRYYKACVLHHLMNSPVCFSEPLPWPA
jgi:hypothetical protein